MGGGAALFDMDGDGDLDAYLIHAGGVVVPREERPGKAEPRSGARPDASPLDQERSIHDSEREPPPGRKHIGRRR